jgi:hypothetical protein
MVTPIEEFERFAERLYNYAVTEGQSIQTKLDFDNAYNNYMEGRMRSKVLHDKTWDIVSTEYIPEVEKAEKQEPKKGRGKGGYEGMFKGKKKPSSVTSVKVKVQTKPPEDYLATFWNNVAKHYRVAHVSKVTDKNGRTYYMKDGKRISPTRIKKIR